MEDTTFLKQVDITAERKVRTNYDGAFISDERNNKSPEIVKLLAEGGKTFYRYLKWQGLTSDPNLLVLSSKHHYYYDHNELNYTTTLIILKKLNLIQHIDSFLQVLHFVLSPGANFIGYFIESNAQKGSGLISRLNKGFTNLLDSRINRKLDRDRVSKLLESHGFKVLDMTLINGLTYLRTENIRRSVG
jgi:hypothetical protein